MWLFKNNPEFYVMCSSNINHYHSNYPMSMYDMSNKSNYKIEYDT
jgi:hypothetical protein